MTKKDWYEAGDQIRNLIQDAIDKEDFSQLSSTISDVVNDTMSGLERALKDSLGSGTGRKDGFGNGAGEAYRANRAEDAGQRGNEAGNQCEGDTHKADQAGRQKAESRRPYQEWTTQARQEAAQRIRRNIENGNVNVHKAKNRSLAVVKPPGRISGAVMKWTGYGCCGAFGLSLAVVGVVSAATGVLLTVPLGILGVLFAGALGLGIGGKKKLELVQRFRKYVNVLGNRTYCMVEELADSVGESSKFVRRDLKKMIRQGFFPQAYLDQKETCLITDQETYRQYQDAQHSYEARQKEQQTQDSRNTSPETKSRESHADGEGQTKSGAGAFSGSDRGSGPDPKCAELIAQGKNYIRHIHACNDRIPDEEMSEKLARLELVVTRIFTEAERNPEVVDDLKKMMSYYLPTTKKLLDAYCNLNDQPISGQNIDSMKREIEATLDTLNAAFEKLLDDLFEEQAWDISSDITVLNTMLAQEGLTGNGFEHKKREGQNDE